MGDDERLEPYFGDYPDGAYWSAARPMGSKMRVVTEEERFSYDGTSLRIMWDEGAGPLWGDGGLLGMDAEWMRRALGLSDALVDELLTWMRDMSVLHYESATADWQEQKRRLDGHGGAATGRGRGAVSRPVPRLAAMRMPQAATIRRPRVPSSLVTCPLEGVGQCLIRLLAATTADG